jgi:hypothetical protein
MKRAFTAFILFLSVPFCFLHAQLIDNGDGTVTDTDKNIMWTKNASLPGSTSLTYQEAVTWVSALNYAGHSDWRLPAGTKPDQDPHRTTPDGQYYYDCNGSEFGHLFYDELGGTGGLRIDQMWDASYNIVANTDPDLAKFENILGATVNASIFWTDIQKDATHNWTFSFQNGSYKSILSSSSSTYRLRAWAVRDVSGHPGSFAAPGNFTVLSGYAGAVILAWSRPADMTDFVGYKVHRYTFQGAHSVLADGIQTQYYRDETAVNGTTYSYSVSAVYGTGESDLVSKSRVRPRPMDLPLHAARHPPFLVLTAALPKGNGQQREPSTSPIRVMRVPSPCIP